MTSDVRMKLARGNEHGFTLGDLLATGALGIKLVVGSDESLDRLVLGAHSIEVDRPARWLDRDWIMLTTGLVLSSDFDQQRQLIAELDDAGVAALGFGVEVVHKDLPPGLIAEARNRDFPVFSVPQGTAFRDVSSVVSRATLSGESGVSSRLVAMQTYLMDSLGEENPRSTVIERLSTLVGADVALILAGGEVIASVGRAPEQGIADRIRERPAAIVHFNIAETHGLAVAAGDPDSPETQWLVVATPAKKPMHPLARPATQVAVPLLIAIHRLDARLRLQDATMRMATLERMLDAEDRHEASAAAAMAIDYGVDVGRGVQVFVGVGSDVDDLERTLAAVTLQLDSSGIPFIGGVRDGHLVGIIEADALSDDLIGDSLLRVNPQLRVGVGRTVREPGDVGASFADAVVAARAQLARSGDEGPVVHYDDLDLLTVLVNELPRDRLGPKVQEWLAPVLKEEALMETLVSYLRFDLDIGRTARALHLHPNSIRYRLTRVEELLGARLRSPSTIVTLEIALLTADLEH